MELEGFSNDRELQDLLPDGSDDQVMIYELKLYFLGFRDIFIWSQYVSPTLVYFVDINQSSVVS